MIIPRRSFASSFGYRYGFNGKENDNDVKGLGNQYDYGFRIYDPRLGRFLSVDPLAKSYPCYTPYQYAGNKAIWFKDLDGLEESPPEYLMEELKVDMSRAPNEFKTESGKVVKTFVKDGRNYNSAWAWAEIQKANPKMFSAANNARIAEGLAPVADDLIVEKFPKFKGFKGQIMEIHHLNHGPTDSYGLPWELHRGKGYTKLWHKFGKAAKVVVATTTLLALYDMAKGNPPPEAEIALSTYQEEFGSFMFDAAMVKDYKGFIQNAEGMNNSNNRPGVFGVFYATEHETLDIILNKQFPDLSKSSPGKFVVGGWNSFYTNSKVASDKTNSVVTHAVIYFFANGSDKGFQPVGIKPINDK